MGEEQQVRPLRITLVEAWKRHDGGKGTALNMIHGYCCHEMSRSGSGGGTPRGTAAGCKGVNPIICN